MATSSNQVNQGTGSPGNISLRSLIAPALSLVLGAFLVLPSGVGPFVRPFVNSSLILWFFLLGTASAILLLLAYVAAGWRAKRWIPVVHIAHGLGNFTAVGALLVLVYFLLSNYRDDMYAAPKIQNIKINPISPEVGKMVEVELDVLNQNGSALAFSWEFDGKPVVGMRTAYIKAPDKPGHYLLVVAAAHASVPSEDLRANNRDDVTVAKFWVDVFAKDDGTQRCDAASVPTTVQICNGGATNAYSRKSITNRKIVASSVKAAD